LGYLGIASLSLVILLVFLPIISENDSVWGAEEDEDVNGGNETKTPQSFDFSINVDQTQVQLQESQNIQVQISINLISGDPQQVSLVYAPVQGLSTFLNPVQGMPSYDATLSITAQQQGDYKIEIRALTDDESVVRTVTISVNVAPPPPAAPDEEVVTPPSAPAEEVVTPPSAPAEEVVTPPSAPAETTPQVPSVPTEEPVAIPPVLPSETTIPAEESIPTFDQPPSETPITSESPEPQISESEFLIIPIGIAIGAAALIGVIFALWRKPQDDMPCKCKSIIISEPDEKGKHPGVGYPDGTHLYTENFNNFRNPSVRFNAFNNIISKECPEGSKEIQEKCEWSLTPEGKPFSLKSEECSTYLSGPTEKSESKHFVKKMTLKVEAELTYTIPGSEKVGVCHCQDTLDITYHHCTRKKTHESEKRCEEIQKEIESLLKKLDPEDNEVDKIFQDGKKKAMDFLREIDSLQYPDGLAAWGEMKKVCDLAAKTKQEWDWEMAKELLLNMIPIPGKFVGLAFAIGEKIVEGIIKRSGGDPDKIYAEAIFTFKKIAKGYAKLICDTISKWKEGTTYTLGEIAKLLEIRDKKLDEYKKELDKLVEEASKIPCIKCEVKLPEDLEEKITELREKIDAYLQELNQIVAEIRKSSQRKLNDNPKSKKFCEDMARFPDPCAHLP